MLKIYRKIKIDKQASTGHIHINNIAYVISLSLYDSPFMITIQFLSNIFKFLRCYTCINIQVLEYTSRVIISYFVVSIFNLVDQKKKTLKHYKIISKFWENSRNSQVTWQTWREWACGRIQSPSELTPWPLLHVMRTLSGPLHTWCSHRILNQTLQSKPQW